MDPVKALHESLREHAPAVLATAAGYTSKEWEAPSGFWVYLGDVETLARDLKNLDGALQMLQELHVRREEDGRPQQEPSD